MKTIIAALDFSDITDTVIQTAQSMAAAHGASLYLLHVEPPEPDFVGYEPGPEHVRDAVASDVIRHFKEENTLRDSLRASGIDAHSLILQGPTAETILREAEALSASLLVIGSHGHGALKNLLLGSVGEALLRHSPCPVVVVPSRLFD